MQIQVRINEEGALRNQRFAFTGAAQTFVVPAGVSSLQIVARGAQGSDGIGGNLPGTGGLGAAAPRPTHPIASWGLPGN